MDERNATDQKKITEITGGVPGIAGAMGRRNPARTVLLQPIQAAMTFPRTLWQAARISLQKEQGGCRKPEPCSSPTIRKAFPPLLERWGLRLEWLRH